MAHKVKCIFCKQEFDRDKEPFVQVSDRRYAHKSCAETNMVQKNQNEQDYENLVNYIKKLFGVDYVSAKIAKQIKDMREEYNFTYSGMLGTLIYWYEIRNGEIEKSNDGIFIIAYKYKDAKEYYENINRVNQLNAHIKNYKLTYKTIEIEAPRPETKPPKLFKLEEEENG